MRMTWLAHCSCAFNRNASIPVVPQIFSTSVLVLPFDSSYLAQAAEVELIQPMDWSSVECPGLTAIQQCSYHYGLIYGNLHFPGYVVHTPQPLLAFTKCTACLGQTRCDVTVRWNSVRQEAVEIAKLVDTLEYSIVTGCDSNGCCLAWWMRLTHSLCLLQADGHTHTHTHTPFCGPLQFCPGLPGWAGIRKVKPGR